MKTKQLFSIALIGALSFTACKKDITPPLQIFLK